jgi:hypothetical protein
MGTVMMAHFGVPHRVKSEGLRANEKCRTVAEERCPKDNGHD